MITNTRDEILDYIRYHGQARPQDLYSTLKISRVALHRQLSRLVKDEILVKTGSSPFVFYEFPSGVVITNTAQSKHLPVLIQQIIDANFLYITPKGEMLNGMPGFIQWAQVYQKNKPIEAIANEYAKTLQKQRKSFSKEGWLDATSKLIDTFKETPISNLLFLDVYSYPIFGRTKMAKLVMYAKQTGEKKLIDQISDIAKPVIEKIIKKFSIEAIAYIPPTVPRPVQFMTEFEFKLKLKLPKIDLVKIVPGDIPIPQKTLSTLSERVINARESIYLKTNRKLAFKNILLIDDVTGSGASFNEVAKKIKRNNESIKNIIAFGLVGNIKGYDVIREI